MVATMNKTLTIIIFIVLIVLSAFFSGSEIVYAQVNKLRIKKMGEEGNKNAKKAWEVSSNYANLISVILIGNNLVNIAASSIATILFVGLFENNGALYAGFIVTAIILVFGEIIPKIFLPRFSTKMSMVFVNPLLFFSFIFKPIAKLTNKLIAKFEKKLEMKTKEEDEVDSGDELKTMVEEIEEEGYIDADTKELVNSAIEIKDTQANEIMTPRVDVVAFDVNTPIKEIFKNEDIFTYSRILIYDDSIDNILGVVKTRNLILSYISNKKLNIRDFIIEPIYIHKSKSITTVLRTFRETKNHIAIVVDEFGGTLGIITLEDILEEIVGNIWDEMDEVEEEVETASDGTILVEGEMNIYDLFEIIEFDDDEYECQYTTVAGWCTEILDGFPKENDTFDFNGYKITIVEVDGYRVEKVKLEKLEIEEE